MKRDLFASNMNRQVIFSVLISLVMIISGCIGNTKTDDVSEVEDDVSEGDSFNVIFNSGFENDSIHVFAENTSAPCTDDMRGILSRIMQSRICGCWSQLADPFRFV